MLFHATIKTVGAALILSRFSVGALVFLAWIYGAVCLCAGFGALLVSAKRNVQAVFTPPITAAA